MDTFRPPFPTSVSHQPCPVCMAPHFPFCPPHHVPVMHPLPQRHESFYSGLQVSHMHHGAFQPHTAVSFGRAPHTFLDPHLQGVRPTEFASHQPYFPKGHPPQCVEDRRDRVSHGQFQSIAPQFPLPGEQNHSFNGSLYAGPPLGDPNGWIEVEYQPQRRHVEMAERIEAGERLLPRSHVAELPRLDANLNMPDYSFERSYRDHYVIPDNARIRRDMTKHNHSMESLARDYEPLKDALRDPMHDSNLRSHLNVIQGNYDHGAQVFVSKRQHMSTPGPYNAQGDKEKKFQAAGLQRREDEVSAHHNQVTQQDAKKEDDLVHQRGLQADRCERREDLQVQESMDHALVKRSLKRKHKQQTLSREEELLIEKGLLDDDLSEPQSHESFSHQAEQPGYQSSLSYTEREALGTKFVEPGERKYESLQFVMSEDQRNKRQEVEMERGTPKFLGDWQPEGLTARQPHLDGSVDSRKPSLLVGQNPHFDGDETNKDFLHRQYLEWEAEEKHMEALRKAERLAREIQQREEGKGMYQANSLLSDDPCKEEVVKESRLQAYQQRQEKISLESAQASSEHNKLQHASQTYGVSPQQHPARQHPSYYSDRLSHFQDAHRQNQHARDGYIQDAQFAEPFGGLQSRQHDGLVQQSTESQWLKERVPFQPHLGTQRSSQLASHQDQQSTPLRSMHPLYPNSAAEELSQERLDRGPSLSFRNQLRSGTGRELPPLPSAAPVNPPPPDSPPPPLPPTHPPFNEPPPPPPPSATFPSARRTTLQGSLEYPQQSLLPDSQGLQETQRLLHTGVSQAHNISQFQLQPPQPLEKSKLVEAVNIFRNPGRLTRPDRFVVILRGLPGSGKSYIAKALRDVEVMNGGSAPRIHSMDDYFTCEVEKEEEVETGSGRSKKKVVKRVMEYCYEPEMEEAYRASMLKAFRKTLEEGMFKFVIVDDRNVLIADFAQFWALAKRSGYETFILEAPYTDVKGCAARNVHIFTEQQIQLMSERWEPTPSLYLKMDVSSLFRADDLNDQDIIEVDMDADDMERDLEEEEEDNHSSQDHPSSLDSERPVAGDRWEDKDHPAKKTASSAKLRQPSSEAGGGSADPKKSSDNALSGLMTTYGKKDKFVHWSDNQGVKGSSTGFSIGSSSQKSASLVIGPGPGYNGMSNLPVVGGLSDLASPELRKSNKFVEQLRAEQEAFKAVFARRRQRIRRMDDEDDD